MLWIRIHSDGQNPLESIGGLVNSFVDLMPLIKDIDRLKFLENIKSYEKRSEKQNHLI